MIHPPIDEPTSICGPLVNLVIIVLASSIQSLITKSLNFPDEIP